MNGTVAAIEKNDHEGHDLDYSPLRYEATLPDVSYRAIRRGLQKVGIARYTARTEEELDKEYARLRVAFAAEQLKIRPISEK